MIKHKGNKLSSQSIQDKSDNSNEHSMVSAAEAGFEHNAKGKIVGINGNRFARYLLSQFTLRYTPEGRFYWYENGYYSHVEEIKLSKRLREVVHEFKKDFWTSTLENAYISALKREALMEIAMDKKRNYLNLENGMLSLKTLKLVPHSPNFNSTIRIPISFDPVAKCSRFDRFLNEIFEEDQDRIAVTQEMMGYCLTAEVKAQKAFILYGSGSNGKSVLAEIMRQLCGVSNVSALSLSELSNSFARLDLMDKCMNLVTEAEVDGKCFNTEYFKAIVSGDPIRAEIKCGPSFVFRPFAKLVFAANTLPYAQDRSYGLSRRLLILPFEKQFSGEAIDPDLLDKLLQELPGILNFALKGLVRLRNNGYRFTQSNVVNNVLKEYKDIINPISAFVEEKLEPGCATDRVDNDVLVRSFQRWCYKNGHSKLATMSVMKFHSQIKMMLRANNIPFTLAAGGGRYLGGIRLKTNEGTEDIELDDL